MRCLVVDDDPLVCELMESFLARVEGVEFSLQASDGVTALSLLTAGGIDTAFIDLNLPGLDGESLLRALPRSLPVVVISASDHFAARSYEFEVTDYLLKPITFPRFMQALRRVQERLGAPPPKLALSNEAMEQTIFVKDGTRIVPIDLTKLLMIKAESNYSQFITDEGSTLSLISMKRLEEILPANFVRVHRSYLVNCRRITKIEDGSVHLGKAVAPISQGQREELLMRLRVIN
jgi:two-component system LytT family response regulator